MFAVGRLKEKILAAQRVGTKTIIAPAANRADIEPNVPESVKAGIRFVYVETARVPEEVSLTDTRTVERYAAIRNVCFPPPPPVLLALMSSPSV